MNWADIAILTTIGISALISLFRGFMREALSLVGLGAAIWVAVAFYNPAADLLADYVAIPTARRVLAFVSIVVVSLLLAGIINHFIGKLIDKTGLSGTDRMLGIVFGFVRGVAIVGAIVMLLGLTQVPQDPWWRESMLMMHFQELALIAINFLPPDLIAHFSYS
ncbi:MAG: CvpA family protein [Gammaproteobacteria bacterium]